MIKEYFLLPVFFLLVLGFTKAQNLVPNPSFEDTIACPDFQGQIMRAANWYTVKNSPDYFNTCSSVHNCSVPNNLFGSRNPATGDAYSGLKTYVSNSAYREELGVQLITPITIGINYFISLKISGAFAPSQNATCSCDKFGILLSTIKYDISNPDVINNFAQFYSTAIISDTINWVVLQGNFIADSVYKFITIGNFFTNSQTDTLHNNISSQCQCYYYLDDVCITIDTSCQMPNGYQELTKNFDLKIFPNPAFERIYIESGDDIIEEVVFYDSIGQEILRNKVSIPNKTNVTIDVSNIIAGVYIVKIVTANFGSQCKKILIIK